MYYLITGITDDDLRDTAYEILVACAGAAGYASDLMSLLQSIFWWLEFHLSGVNL